MKTAIITILWAASLFCAYRAGHIVSNRFDYSAPSGLKAVIDRWPESQVATNDWPRNPRFRQFGKFVLTRPENPKEAGLFIGVLGRPPFPAIYVWDDAKSGRPNGFSLCDAAGNQITAIDRNGDGVFDRVGLCTTNGVYRDEGLTGTWNFQKAPSK